MKWDVVSSGSSAPSGPAGGDLAGTYPNPTIPGLAAKATDANVVHLAGSETITGAKNFTGGATINGTAIVVTSDTRLSDQRTPLDGSVTTAKIVDGAVTEAKLATATQTKLNNKVDKNELVFDVKDFGALGDGTTDDTTAVAAALTAASNATVYFPPGIYLISALTLNGPILDGQNAATIKKTGSSSTFISVTGRSTIKRLVVDANNLVTGTIVNITAGVTDVTIEDCTIKNGPSPVLGVRVRDGCDRTMIRRCILDSIFQSVYIDGTSSDVTVQDSFIKNWVQRGIYVVGTSTTATNRLSILRNKITDMAAGGSVRQPIAVQGNDAFSHTSMKVSGNTVIGPNKSWTATDPGTADQISIQHVTGFQMCDNISLYGGDNGLVASFECSDGVMTGNVAMYNDTGGLDIGAATAAYTRNITVSTNTFMNNGQARNADRNDVGCVGIRMYNAVNCIVAGNALGDEQITKTQKYGVSFTNCTNVVYGPDINAGNAIALYNLDSGNSGVSTAVGGATAQPVQGAVLRLSGGGTDYTSAPAVSSWTPGDLDIRAMVTPNTWASGATQTIICQSDIGVTEKSFYLFISPTGRLGLAYSTTGTTTTLINSTVAIPGAVDGKTLSVRATFDVDNGGGAGTVTFYTSTDGGTNWTSYDTKPTTGTSALHKSSHAIYVGVRDGSDAPFAGLVHFAEFRDGIAGTVVVNVDYRGKWSGTDAEGNTWTISGTAWSWVVVEATVFGLVADLAALGGGSTTPPTYDVYTTAGSFTWNKPTGAVSVDAYCIGGGGAGASGRQGAAASARCGGGGGGGGIKTFTSVLASSLSATENVVVGAGGTGGAAVATINTDGNPGVLGSASSFGTSLPRMAYARMGLFGNGGTAATGTGGAVTSPGASIGQAAGAVGAAGANAGGTATSFGTSWTAGGGGGGGGITTADAVSAGGTGSPNASDSTTTAGGTAGGGTGSNGTTVRTGSYLPGGGGAGGGSSITGPGGAGGNGIFGGAGGGGGASLNGNNSGAGGNGGSGLVVVVTHFS